MELRLEQISKRYARGGIAVDALVAASVTLRAGDLMVIHGPSGSGKSTLLLMSGGMLKPDSGSVIADGKDVYASGSALTTRFRRRNVGFVFQRLHLIDYLTVRENLRFALALRGGAREVKGEIESVASQLGIQERLEHYPGELSIGEQQRAAVARALMGKPDILLADEPTGNLDPENARAIATVFADYAKAGRIVVMVTHNHEFLSLSTQRAEIRAGRIMQSAA